MSRSPGIASLEQLRSGPFNLWMLREPRNIMLEVGPHCLAPMLDLVGSPKLAGAARRNPVDLPGVADSTAAGMSRPRRTRPRSPCTSRSRPASRSSRSTSGGAWRAPRSTSSGTLYVLHRHTRYGMDFDRYRMARDEAGSLAAQARRTLNRYLLSKLKLSIQGQALRPQHHEGLAVLLRRARWRRSIAGSRPSWAGTSSASAREIGRRGVGRANRRPGRGPVRCPSHRAGTSRPADILRPWGRPDSSARSWRGNCSSAGHRIRLLVRNPGRLPDDLRGPDVEVIAGDLTRTADLEQGHRREPVRLSTWPARMSRPGRSTSEQDIEVTRQVAEACLSRGVDRLIYTGTIDSYYAGTKAGTITEETPLDPHHRLAESLCPGQGRFRGDPARRCTASEACRWSSSGLAS